MPRPTHRTSLSLCLVLAALCASPALTSAAPSPVFEATIRGDLAVTGSAFGVSGSPTAATPGVAGSLGALLAADPADRYGGFGAGTTSDWPTSASAAVLELPPGAQVVHAELVWGGSWQIGGRDVSAALDDAIRFDGPGGGADVTPHGGRLLDGAAAAGFPVQYYVRHADVTGLVAAGGAGLYRLIGAPVAIDTRGGELAAGGWSLYVAWYEGSAPTRNLALSVGAEWVDEQAAQRVVVDGFCTPPEGSVQATWFVSALEGDAHRAGDRLSVVAPGGGRAPLGGLLTPPDNVFAAQIAGRSGMAVATDRADVPFHDAHGAANVPGGRQGWDLLVTELDGASPALTNRQQSATLLAETSGDSFVLTAVGTSIDMNAPSFAPGDSATLTSVGRDELELLVPLVNDGRAAAVDVLFRVPPDPTLAYVEGSFSLDGATGDATGGDVDAAALAYGVPLGDLAVGASVTVRAGFQRIDAAGPRAAVRPEWTYAWRACPGGALVSEPAFGPVLLDPGPTEGAADGSDEGSGEGSGDPGLTDAGVTDAGHDDAGLADGDASYAGDTHDAGTGTDAARDGSEAGNASDGTPPDAREARAASADGTAGAAGCAASSRRAAPLGFATMLFLSIGLLLRWTRPGEARSTAASTPTRRPPPLR